VKDRERERERERVREERKRERESFNTRFSIGRRRDEEIVAHKLKIRRDVFF